MINVAILGYGVVGSGVSEVIRKNSQSIAARAGDEIRVKRILDVRDFPEGPDSELLTKDADLIFNDASINIVVETIGGAKIAHEFTKRAFSMKKSVVTSNKELVATHGPELLKMAADQGVSYLFEASVGGGIPIIRPLNQCLAANIINGVTGILNGTTNYILTQMRKEGRDFADALKSAQEKGYAEANPTADIEGHDSCRKIAILSSIAYGEFVDCNGIYTEGITQISLADMQYAELLDSVIKLVAISKRVGDRIFARVSPAIISKAHPLSNVEDVFNAIVVKGDAIGDAMFYGRGAGKLPTASAVVADIIDIVRHIDSNDRNVWPRKEYDNLIDISLSETKYLVRVSVRNMDEAKRFIRNTFKTPEFYQLNKPEMKDELAFVTETATEKELTGKINTLKGIGSIRDVMNAIRIEDE